MNTYVVTILDLKVFSSCKVSAVPIVEKDTNRLVGTLSASDLRGFNVSKLHFLGKRYTSTTHLPVLTLAWNRSFLPNTDALSQLFLLHLTRPLKEFLVQRLTHLIRNAHRLDLLVEHRLHRVWLVEEGVPVGVITLTDLLESILKFYKAKEE